MTSVPVKQPVKVCSTPGCATRLVLPQFRSLGRCSRCQAVAAAAAVNVTLPPGLGIPPVRPSTMVKTWKDGVLEMETVSEVEEYLAELGGEHGLVLCLDESYLYLAPGERPLLEHLDPFVYNELVTGRYCLERWDGSCSMGPGVYALATPFPLSDEEVRHVETFALSGVQEEYAFPLLEERPDLEDDVVKVVCLRFIAEQEAGGEMLSTETALPYLTAQVDAARAELDALTGTEREVFRVLFEDVKWDLVADDVHSLVEQARLLSR